MVEKKVPCEVYSRVVGYYAPVSKWNRGKRVEFDERKPYSVEESLERMMFETAIDRLEAAGFEHYEVSNFARPGFRCRHNEAYWDLRPWEAFGPGAARFDGRTRTTNHRSTTTWIAKTLAGEDATGDVDAMNAEQAAWRLARAVAGCPISAGDDAGTSGTPADQPGTPTSGNPGVGNPGLGNDNGLGNAGTVPPGNPEPGTPPATPNGSGTPAGGRADG